jgi:hypothetical protein
MTGIEKPSWFEMLDTLAARARHRIGPASRLADVSAALFVAGVTMVSLGAGSHSYKPPISFAIGGAALLTLLYPEARAGLTQLWYRSPLLRAALLLMALFAAYAGVSALWADIRPERAAEKIFEPLAVFACFFLAAPIVGASCSKIGLRRIGAAVLAAAVLSAAAGMLAFDGSGRMMSLFSRSPIFDGAFWTLMAALALAGAPFGSEHNDRLGAGWRWLRRLLPAAAVLLIIAAFMTGSRSAILCLAGVVVFTLLVYNRRLAGRLVLSCVLGVALVWAAFLAAERFAPRAADMSAVANVRVVKAGFPRLLIWRNGLERGTSSLENLLFGEGHGERVFLFGPGSEPVFHPHSLYLSVFLSYGLIGAALFGAAWALFLVAALGQARAGVMPGAIIFVQVATLGLVEFDGALGTVGWGELSVALACVSVLVIAARSAVDDTSAA